VKFEPAAKKVAKRLESGDILASRGDYVVYYG
jgi:hypothetical protein